MKIAILQTDAVQGAFEENLAHIENFVRIAKEGNADLAIFPEMFLCGFNYKANAKFLAQKQNYAEDKIASLAKKYEIALCGTFPHIEGNATLPSNRLVIFDNTGKQIATYDKTHLFGVFNEDKHIARGENVVVADTIWGKIGLSICYDIRFADLFTSMATTGAKLIIMCAAFPHPRSEHWTTLCKARAIENQCFFAAVNRAGEERFPNSTIKYCGLSAVYNPWGETIAQCKLDVEDVAFADIDLSEADKVRAKIPSFSDRRSLNFYYKLAKNMENQTI